MSSCKFLKNFHFLSTLQDTSIKSYKIKMYVHSIVTKRMILYVYTLRCIINLLKLKTQNWFKTKRNLGIRRLSHNFSSSVLWPHFRQMKHTAHQRCEFMHCSPKARFHFIIDRVASNSTQSASAVALGPAVWACLPVIMGNSGKFHRLTSRMSVVHFHISFFLQSSY